MNLHQITEPRIESYESRTPAQAAVLAQQIRFAIDAGYRHSALRDHLRRASSADASIIVGPGPADTPRFGVRSGDHYYLENESIWLHASAVTQDVAIHVCPRCLEELVERRRAELLAPFNRVGVASLWILGFACLFSEANDWAVAFGVLAIALQRHLSVTAKPATSRDHHAA